MMRGALSIVTAAVLTGALGSAQQPVRDPRLNRAAAPTLSISGRVVAAGTDTPLRRAVVRLTSDSLPKPRATRTDERGRYEFAGLPANGSFTVSAGKPQYLRLEYGQRRPFEPGRPIVIAGKSLTAVDFQLPRAAAVSGTVLDATGDPVDQMWVFVYRRGFVDGRPVMKNRQAAVTNDAGQFRVGGLAPGDYYVVTRERATPTELTDEPTGYATTFYPGTIDERQAQPIRLAVGQEVVNLDIPAVTSRTAVLSGQVVDVNGKPAPFSTRVMLTESTGSGIGGSISGGGMVQFDGRFFIRGVRPGSYQLMARDPALGDAVLPIEVIDSDLAGLTIVMGSGATVSGRIVSASGQVLPFAPPAVDVSARPLVDQWQVRGTARGSIRPDWTILWAGLTGPRLFRATKLPDGWWMRAVLRGDQDVTDDPVTLGNGDALKDLSIVLDDHPTRIEGDVRNAKDADVGDCTVVVFADDAGHWGPESRFVRAARPSHQARFRIEGLPPGAYLAAAVEYVEQGQWLDPQYLESLRPSAVKVTVAAGERVTLRLALPEAR